MLYPLITSIYIRIVSHQLTFWGTQDRAFPANAELMREGSRTVFPPPHIRHSVTGSFREEWLKVSGYGRIERGKILARGTRGEQRGC